MGEVYRAEDTQLKRTVAIKRLTRRVQTDHPYQNELLKEAQRASALNHPGVAAVYDVFVHGDELFLVMEYIAGSTLRERLQSPILASEFCDIAIQCTEALGAAHERGILHGDLKPANIMLTQDRGVVKICDFGLARRVSNGNLSSRETLSTTLHAGVAGTPAYMAPETFLEKPVDLRADIFSLGVVFYEMLSGRNPFSASSFVGTIDRIRDHSPKLLDQVNPNVPARLARIVERMIEKDPSKRYQSLRNLTGELAEIRASLPVAETAIPISRSGRRWIPAAILIVALATLSAPLVWKWQATLPAGQSIPSELNLAVLPFAASGTGADRQFFSQGLTETLNDQLSSISAKRKFQVASLNEIRSRKVTTPQEAREQVGANIALTGSLEYAGNLVRIHCRLVDTKSGTTVRTKSFNADASNPLAVQDSVMEAALSMLGFSLLPEERAAMAGLGTRQPGAFDFYLQARGYLLNFDRIEDLDNAITVFRKALEIDSRYALAYAGLGEAYWRKHELTKSNVWVEPARAACEGALGIDANLAEAHACMGLVFGGIGEYERAADEFSLALKREPANDLFYLGLATVYEKMQRYGDAEQTYLRAINIRPHYWGTYNALGAYYYRNGKFDQALTMFKQVVALSPDSFRGYSSVGATYFMKDNTTEAIAAFEQSLAIKQNYAAASNLGALYYFDGQFLRAATAFRQALVLDQGNYQVWGNLANALFWAGDKERAATAYKRAKELAGEQLRIDPRNASIQMALANYNAALGDNDKAFDYFSTVLKLAPNDAHTLFQIAAFYEFRMGKRDQALAWLAKAIERGQTWREINSSPTLRELRKDPNFQKLRTGG